MIKLIITKNKKQALEKAPWAIKLEKIQGGYLAFQTITEYTNWKHEDKWKEKHYSSYVSES